MILSEMDILKIKTMMGETKLLTFTLPTTKQIILKKQEIINYQIIKMLLHHGFIFFKHRLSS